MYLIRLKYDAIRRYICKVRSRVYDDSQLYAVCNKPSDSVTVIENCISEVREWMQSNPLVLNDNKTEVVHFTSRHKKYIEHLKSLKIGGCDIILKKSWCIF